MKKYWALGKAEWLDALSYRGEIFLWILIELIPVFIMTSLWLSNQSGVVSTGYTFSQLITYYLVIVIISRLTTHYFDEGTQNEIRDGTFSRFLLKPLRFPQAFLASSLGGKLFHFIFLFIPLISTAIIILHNSLVFPSVTNFSFFILSLVIAFLIQYSLSVMITSVAFYFEQASAFMHVKWVLENIAGGYLIPLTFYPIWGQKIVNVLPFKYLYFIPAQLFLGTMDRITEMREIAISLVWMTLLLLLSQFLWKKGVKYYSGVGG